MAFPGYPLDTNRTNLTAAPDRHPQDHNEERAALNHLQGQVDSNLTSTNAAIAAINASLPTATLVNVWVPTWTNITLGSGATVNTRYVRIGPVVHAAVAVGLGTAPSVTGDITFTIPVTAISTSSFGTSGFLYDVSGGFVSPIARVALVTTTTAKLMVAVTTGTYAQEAAAAAAIPFAWAVSDQITAGFSYFAA